MINLDSKTYEKLYAKYLKRHPKEMIDLAGGVKDKIVLDLCGGTGRLAYSCIEAGAKEVVLVDSSSKMADNINHSKIRVYNFNMQDFFDRACNNINYDVVFCRQAVNYWIHKELFLEKLNCIMDVGSLFVFNTFNTKPSKNIRTREYEYNGNEYLEAYWMDDDDRHVHHVQCCSGMIPHITTFLWISPDEFYGLLSPYFKVEIIVEGRTTFYKCLKESPF